MFETQHCETGHYQHKCHPCDIVKGHCKGHFGQTFKNLLSQHYDIVKTFKFYSISFKICMLDFTSSIKYQKVFIREKYYTLMKQFLSKIVKLEPYLSLQCTYMYSKKCFMLSLTELIHRPLSASRCYVHSYCFCR